MSSAVKSVSFFILQYISSLPIKDNLPLVGNVGDSKALAEVVKSWTCPIRFSSTKDILKVSLVKFNVLQLNFLEYIFCFA